MYYLQDERSGQYVSSIVKLRGADAYAVYFKDEPSMARWATEQGARDALGRLLDCEYTNPPGVAVHLADGTAIMQKRYDLYGTVQKALYPGEALSEKNGNIVITGRSAGGGSNGHEEPYYGHCILTFDAELPVEEVVSITIGGLNIPVE